MWLPKCVVPATRGVTARRTVQTAVTRWRGVVGWGTGWTVQPISVGDGVFYTIAKFRHVFVPQCNVAFEMDFNLIVSSLR